MAAPWEGKEEKEEREGKQCGAPECGIVCGTGEFCANTGAAELCDSVKCIKFDVWWNILSVIPPSYLNPCLLQELLEVKRFLLKGQRVPVIVMSELSGMKYV